ncbi:MAG: metal-dependent hydrolase beta-lactamase superfamily [Spirochaetes bacterium]|nr:MAG: metal-dependent hydrolase beta-lactamase superfamily [Spirochaetota bacterium]
MESISLVELTKTARLIPGPTNVGLLEFGGEAWLVDSGNDKEAGRKLLALVQGRGLKLKVILNTHSNADHIGGNAYLQGATQCEIWAPRIEAAFVEEPALEALMLWGGSPPRELKNKHFEAKPSMVTRKILGDEKIEGASFVALPGHFLDMTGVLTADGAFFLGDAAFSPEVLDKHKVPFVLDHRLFRASLSKIQATPAKVFVPSHGEPSEDPLPLVKANIEALDRIHGIILESLKTPKTFEDALSALCDSFGIGLNATRYALVGCTLRSLLTYLREERLVDSFFEGSRMKWILL